MFICLHILLDQEVVDTFILLAAHFEKQYTLQAKKHRTHPFELVVRKCWCLAISENKHNICITDLLGVETSHENERGEKCGSVGNGQDG